MNFIERIGLLKNIYSESECKSQENAYLYGIPTHQPPIAEHIVFKPMPEETIDNLVANYKLIFPNELLALYRTMNGADLFWTVRFLGRKKLCIPMCNFSIYGVPLTNDRKRIEPYNISIEDLNRLPKTPESWLKFGSYYRPDNMRERLDLFVDTNDKAVYAVGHEGKECKVFANWSSIDSCLCSVFDLLALGDARGRFGGQGDVVPLLPDNRAGL